MKKLYSKPEIMFESFTLSTNIAGDCEIKTHTPAKGECAYTIPGDEFSSQEINVFIEKHICSTTKAEGEYDNLCYNTFDGRSLFNS